MTPTAMAIGRMILARQAALVLGGTAVLAIASQVTVPFYPVPMTLQTLAVLMVGLTLGARLGTITVLTWLGEAALGAPVLANFGNAAAFVGPTAGFLAGFVAMAWIAGRATDRGLNGPLGLSLVTVAASLALYLPGLAWPLGVAHLAAGIDAGWASLSAGQAIAGFVTPFVVGDVLKAVIAALLVSGGIALRGRG